MKLSIRMKIFLPVMFLLIAFPVAAWFVFSYALDGHMNYNADSMAVAYIQLRDQEGRDWFGVGIDHNINLAPLRGILSAINRSVRHKHD